VTLNYDCLLLTEIKVGTYSRHVHIQLTSVAFVEVVLEYGVTRLSYDIGQSLAMM
jgi:hypothetical protein